MVDPIIVHMIKNEESGMALSGIVLEVTTKSIEDVIYPDDLIPFHLRVDRTEDGLSFILFDDKNGGRLVGFEITGFSPFLGHDKIDECCG